jgi:hypothetical protein
MADGGEDKMLPAVIGVVVEVVVTVPLVPRTPTALLCIHSLLAAKTRSCDLLPICAQP